MSSSTSPCVVQAAASWLRTHPGDAQRAPVPGASTEQRRHLAALGGVAGALVPQSLRSSLSPALLSWLASPEPPPDIMRLFAKEANLEEVFADLYNELLPPMGRRVLGTFFTPKRVVDDMLTLSSALTPAPTRVVDPGAGVGAFTAAAARRWRAAEIHAVDINVVTLGLLAARASRMTAPQLRRLTLHHGDFLSWVRHNHGPGATLTVGNPPYTRHQLLTAKQKDDGLAAAGALLVNRNSTMAAYMVAAVLGRLRPMDGAVLLLPSNWLRAHYASLIREWLWKRASRAVEVHVLRDQGLFPDANVSASILGVGPVRPRSASLRFKVATTGRTVDAARRAQQPPHDWYSMAHGGAGSAPNMSDVALGDVVRVRRGAATGANHFFVITRELADRLATGFAVRAAGRLHALDDDVLDEQAHDRLSKTGARCWMLRLPPDADVTDLQWYLNEGIAAGVADTYLVRQRPRWWSIEQLTPPRLLIQPMTKNRFRVVTNAVEAFHTNTLYGLYPLGLRGSAVESLAAWLRSDQGQASLRQIARPLSSGLMRIEPRALAELRLPSSIASSLTGAAPTDEVKRSP